MLPQRPSAIGRPGVSNHPHFRRANLTLPPSYPVERLDTRSPDFSPWS